MSIVPQSPLDKSQKKCFVVNKKSATNSAGAEFVLLSIFSIIFFSSIALRLA